MTSATVSDSFDDRRTGTERYEPNARTDLIAFRRAMHGAASTACDPDKIRWMFEDDPNIGQAASALWLCKRDGKIIAQQAARPVTLKVGNHEQDAAWLTQRLTDPLHANDDIDSALTARLSNHPLVLGLEVDSERKQELLHSGWIDLGNAPLFVRILDAGRAVAHHHDKPVLRGLGTLANAPLSAVDAFIQARIAHRKVRMHEIDRFDGRVDKLWEQASPHYPVVAKRDRKNLNWRFADYPDRGRYRCFYFFVKDQLKGYVVLRMDKSPLRAVGTIVDFLATPEWMWFVLGRTLGVFRRAGMVQVNIVHTSAPGQKALRELGFMRRNSGWPLLYRATHLAGGDATLLASASNWFVTGYDGALEAPHDDGTNTQATAAQRAPKRPLRVTLARREATELPKIQSGS